MDLHGMFYLSLTTDNQSNALVNDVMFIFGPNLFKYTYCNLAHQYNELNTLLRNICYNMCNIYFNLYKKICFKCLPNESHVVQHAETDKTGPYSMFN